MNIGIIGGGLSGITLQSLLAHSSEVLEKEDRPGGLCRTFVKDGFYYDIGGHILFSKDKEIMDFAEKALGDNINLCRRNNKILYKGRYIKYPFENGLGALDKEDIDECLSGYLHNDHPKPANFREWIYHTFGDGIARKYLIPYNEKIWKYPLGKMGIEWVERVPKPPLEDVLKSASGIETEGYTHQLYFKYPARGGIESLIRSMVKPERRITSGFEVKSARKDGNGWKVSDGKADRVFEKLVLTIPVNEAVRMFENVPEDVRRAAAGLVYNSVRIVLVGVNNESLFDKSATYIPDSSVLAHRVCYMGFFSRNNVPAGKSSMIAEISTRKGEELYRMPDHLLIERTIEDLSGIGIVNKNEIVATEVKNIEYGYVIYNMDYRRNIEVIKRYFNSIGVELLGRFAEFEYINMDEVIKRSIKLAHKLNAAKA